ncbi:MAG TPA: hypothetical protein VMZ53_00735 [Kofleriaceae bacterium]|nr:hypothetical protein [Kofleriaceae bacterium]
MRIIKWPWLSVSIVPTTLQRIDFTADQVTRERIGVTVTGIAVYRIAAPLLAFRVLNFQEGGASEKLAATMREMFVGAARRLIANLALDDCLTRRKEAIAGYLMDEIAPVVGGEGSPEDTTNKGWGVVIDTIEIQQVRVQSQQVFAHLQAPYRAEIATRAELAELQRERQVVEQRGESERKLAEQEADLARRKSEQEAELARRRSELERERALHQIAIAEEHRRAQAAAEVASLEAERGRVEALHIQSTLQLEQERQLEAMRMELDRRRAEEKDYAAQLSAAHQRRLAEIENLVAQGRVVTNLVTHGLPKIAEALAQTIGTVNYTQIGNGAGTGPLEAVPAAIAQLLALAKSFGVELPGASRPVDAVSHVATERT